MWQVSGDSSEGVSSIGAGGSALLNTENRGSVQMSFPLNLSRNDFGGFLKSGDVGD